tara:strand:- start:1827 stop:2084 length:258 start_codon:yes stop_codon:yes gene_type:complete
MKIEMFDKEWEVKPLTYREKRELWQMSLKAFPDGEINQDKYFDLMLKVEKMSGLKEKDLEQLNMGDVDLLLQEIYQQYMGIEKKG